MNTKNLLYASGLSAVMMLGGCEKTETPKETKRQLEVGEYAGMINGKRARYRVAEIRAEIYDCYLTQQISPIFTIADYDCDNNADKVWWTKNYERKDLLKAGRAEQFDSLLREGQKLVRPENKVPDNTQKELDDLLKP